MFYAGETYWLNNTKLNAFFATKEKTKRQNLDFLVVPFSLVVYARFGSIILEKKVSAT